MKTLIRGMILTLVLLTLSAPLFAGGAQEADFLSELQDALEEEGLSEVEAQVVIDAAGSYDWNGMNRVDPEVVAEALARIGDEGTELSAEEMAQLAYQLCESSVELRREGYSRSEVAQAMLGSVEQLQSRIRTWKDGDLEEPLGDTVRNTVSERARETVRERETESRDDASGNGEPRDTPAADKAPVATGKGASGSGGR